MSMEHREAFCLMKYQSDDRSESETLWNSRDGVTPFIISNRDGTKHMRHVEYGKDRCDPNYIPLPGMRIFVSATEELVKPRLLAYVDDIFDKHGARAHFGTKEKAYAALLPDWLHDGEAPWVLTVPSGEPELQKFYKKYLLLFKEGAPNFFGRSLFDLINKQ
jgi:hypothetical protein